ncbi:MAG: hypothetical protein JJT96_04030 [Opitutales bacterium]|nr:hypothetical protein [Opitutales bacterium]
MTPTASISPISPIRCHTLEFLGLWEQINNPRFNPVEFDGIRMQAGLNRITQIAIQQMKLLTAENRLPNLPEGRKGE